MAFSASGDGTLKGLCDWLVYLIVSFVDGAMKAVLCFIYSGVLEQCVTEFQSSTSHCVAFCPVGVSGISDGHVIRARSFLVQQRVLMFLCIAVEIRHKDGTMR